MATGSGQTHPRRRSARAPQHGYRRVHPQGPSLPQGPVTGRKLTLLSPHQPGWRGQSKAAQASHRTAGSPAWLGDRWDPGQLSRFSLSALASADLNYSVL